MNLINLKTMRSILVPMNCDFRITEKILDDIYRDIGPLTSVTRYTISGGLA